MRHIVAKVFVSQSEDTPCLSWTVDGVRFGALLRQPFLYQRVIQTLDKHHARYRPILNPAGTMGFQADYFIEMSR
jgi:hypothetical protein